MRSAILVVCVFLCMLSILAWKWDKIANYYLPESQAQVMPPYPVINAEMHDVFCMWEDGTAQMYSIPIPQGVHEKETLEVFAEGFCNSTPKPF